MKKLTLEGDVEVITFAPPPKNFDPLGASASDLEKYGFPAMPDDPHQRERYARVFGQLKHKLNHIEPTFRVNKDRSHGIRKRDPKAGTETSTNWSGGVVYAPAGQAFKWVQGDWV